MARTWTPEEFRALLQRTCDAYGGRANVALVMGVSEATISNVLRGAQEPGPKILDALGLERVYRKREERNG